MTHIKEYEKINNEQLSLRVCIESPEQ